MAARHIKTVVRNVGARDDVRRRAAEMRAASRAADRLVGKPGPHIGQSVLSCATIQTKFQRWQKDTRVNDRRQATFARHLGVSVSTLQRRLDECGMDLVFVRSRKAPK